MAVLLAITWDILEAVKKNDVYLFTKEVSSPRH